MRIITGKAKGCPIRTLPTDLTRPTSQRVKEAIFSMLQFDLEHRVVLDLFAGSGQMALEALSRGASRAVLVDQSRDAVAVIRENAQKAKLAEQCDILQMDFRRYLQSCRVSFDLVFIDPPYADGTHTEALAMLLRGGLLKSSSILVCETGSDDIFAGDAALASCFDVIKQTRYSISYVTVLMPKKEAILG